MHYARGESNSKQRRLSKPRRPSPPDLTFCLEAIYHHLPLGLVIPEVPEVARSSSGIILSYPLQALSSSASLR